MTKNLPTLKCDVCGRKPGYVCASMYGAISNCLCVVCLDLGREPWAIMVGGLVGVPRGQVAEELKPYIRETCKYYNRTEDDLWNEIEKVDKDFDEYMKRDKLDSKI